MNDWFNELYIKEVPIEEQIRGQVRAECHYMDKADIYEWIAQDEIKIMNLQSKIDKATKKADELRKYIYRELVDFNVCGSTEAHCLAKDLLDILEEVENVENN